MIHGEDLILALDDVPCAASKECSLEISQQMIECSSPVSGRVSEYIPGKYSWTISTNGLCSTMEAVDTLSDAMREGTAMTMKFYDTDLKIYKTGTVYITSLSITGAKGSLCTYSASFQGSGVLKDVVPAHITNGVANGAAQRIERIDDTSVFVQDGGTSTLYTVHLTPDVTVRVQGYLPSSELSYWAIVPASELSNLIANEPATTVAQGNDTVSVELPAGEYYAAFVSANSACDLYIHSY